MMSASEILAELARRGISQGDIAKALGITRPNANKLYKAATKTGKPRSLTYDEGLHLIRTFNLDQAEESSVKPMSAPVARLAVQYVAQQLGVKIDPDDARVGDLALDLEAYSEFAADVRPDDNLGRAEGWLEGRRSRPPAKL